MRVTGSDSFVEVFDQEAYENFLRSKGLSEKKIETLQVRFMHELPMPLVSIVKLFSKPWGHYTLLSNSIEIATFWVKDESDLRKLQKVILHESSHLCGGIKEEVMIFLWIGFLMLLDYGFLSLIQNIIQSFHMLFIFQGIIMAVFQIVFLLLLTRLGYAFAPNEYRANKWMKFDVQLFKKDEVNK